MLVTISGPPGGGKTTTATAVADVFGLEYVSGGHIFRSLAEERGYSLAEFNARAEEDPQIDRDLDRRLRETAQESDDLVLESRLSGWMAGDLADLKLWLDAPLGVRASRIADREDRSVAAAREETVTRETSEKRRYESYYGIDFENQSIYDLSVNTARWDAATVTAIVETAIGRYESAADEGAVPVDISYDF